jgi:uncharacterized membrane protein
MTGYDKEKKMASPMTATRSRWQDVINLVLGLWLFFSPWILTFKGVSAAATSAWIFGILVVALALLAIFLYQQWEEWLSAAIGVWVFISPWVLRVSTEPKILWNSLIVGALLVILALWSASLEHGSGEVTSGPKTLGSG